ncbi:MAG: hypothetical protein HDT14_07455 [Oscillibacter sp.]|nr:hypothetical protein [Oscillibacter sp.]
MSNDNLSEKVSVNINSSTLSQIDLLVDNGYYSNRSDFINQSLRAALQQQQSTLDRIIGQREENAYKKKEQWFMGLFGVTAADAEIMYQNGGGFSITGYGVLIIDDDIDQEKLFAAVRAISVRGKVICARSIKDHYGLK